MNVLLRKITIISNETIKILNTNVEKTYFGKSKVKETISEEAAVYVYWIEFHVDQGRFYYGETKPMEIPNRPNVFIYQTNTSHTKNGLDKSLEIINNIRKRTEIVFPSWKIDLYQIPNISIYRQFDKIVDKEQNS